MLANSYHIAIALVIKLRCLEYVYMQKPLEDWAMQSYIIPQPIEACKRQGSGLQVIGLA